MSVERYGIQASVVGDGFDTRPQPSPGGPWVKYEDYQAAETRAEDLEAQRDYHHERADREQARADAAADDALARWAESQFLAAKVSGLQRAIQEVQEELERRIKQCGAFPNRAAAYEAALDLLRSKLEPTERHGGEGELATERSDKAENRDTIRAKYEELREKIGEEIERLRVAEKKADASVEQWTGIDEYTAGRFSARAEEREDAADRLQAIIDRASDQEDE